LKRPSDAEVASAQPVKQTKKAMFRPIATTTATGMVAWVSGSKVVADAKKIVMPAPKCHVPAIGVMAEASSTESQESLPHGQAAWDSLPENKSISEPHSLSPQA
jgi:hypothetical protein